MVAAAADRGASIEFVPITQLANPIRRAGGHILVDSLVAWAVAPWFLLRRSHRPIAAMVHQAPGGIDHGPIRTRLQRALDLSLYRNCSLVIAASGSLRDELVVGHGIAAGRVRVVEPGSDIPIDRSTPTDLRCGRKIALLTVANWLANKGIVELLDAVAALPADLVTLHLVGNDELDRGYAHRVRNRIAAPGLMGRVVVHGVLEPEELGRLYGAADVFVLPSYKEAYGTVFGEALAAGLPVVGWRSGNLPNLIEDGREGCLLAPGDVSGLSVVLRRLATDRTWRGELTAHAAERGRSLPKWSDTADAFFGLFGELSASSGD
jgi:glycosyltransferase involved in cell wall biosynthesis